MFIKELKDSYELILCKINGKPMGKIFYESLTSLSRGIEKVSELSFTVNKYYGVEGLENPLYNELKTERLIILDNIETYVIKNIVEQNETVKTVTAYSREKKLFRITAEFEDICITLKTLDNTVSNCYTLDELLYEDTGWHLGNISDRVLYVSNSSITDILQEEKGSLSNVEKLRYQESVSSNWYDYIMNDIAEQFECYPIFDSYNKLVHLYDEAELGENLQLILSYDNYLKSKEKTTDTEDIVTRLVLSGNNDLTVVGCNPTGYRYIEDFSYFMESGEMSDELTSALELYNEVIKKLIVQWNNYRGQKAYKEGVYAEKQKSLLINYNTIQSLEIAIGLTENEYYMSELTEQLGDRKDERYLLEKDIDTLYEEIRILSEQITIINKLCKKKYATKTGEVGGELIFNDELLDELKEFTYQDTYSNDNITDELLLMETGMRKLSEMKYPTRTWSIDSMNFVERLIDNEFRNQWNGQLGLGDMIILKDEDTENDVVYLVGYTQNFKDKTLQLELSNKKGNKEFSLSIGERLTQAKEVYKNYNKNKYLLNSIKLNRLGVEYDKINGQIL